MNDDTDLDYLHASIAEARAAYPNAFSQNVAAVTILAPATLRSFSNPDRLSPVTR